MCPHCARGNQDAALICRFCEQSLQGATLSNQSKPPVRASAPIHHGRAAIAGPPAKSQGSTVAIIGVVAVVAIAWFLWSRGIDQEQFEPLYRAGKQVAGATEVGVTLVGYRELLQQLATEIDIAEDKAKSDIEKRLVEAYRNVLQDHKDAQTIWTAKIDLAGVTPKGESTKILMSGPSEGFFGPIVDKYDLRHLVSNGVITAESMQQGIWAVASKDLAIGEAIYNGTTVPSR